MFSGYVLGKPDSTRKMRILKSLIVPKNMKRGPFGIFEHLFCSKISEKIEGGPSGDKTYWKNFVSQCQKKRKWGPLH